MTVADSGGRKVLAMVMVLAVVVVVLAVGLWQWRSPGAFHDQGNAADPDQRPASRRDPSSDDRDERPGPDRPAPFIVTEDGVVPTSVSVDP